MPYDAPQLVSGGIGVSAARSEQAMPAAKVPRFLAFTGKNLGTLPAATAAFCCVVTFL